MELKRISELPRTTTVDLDTLIPIVKDSENYKISPRDLIKGEVGMYNVSKLHPLESGYYNAVNARIAVPAVARYKGIYLTFETSEKVWLTMQFLGGDWLNEGDWKFLQTAENVVTIDGLQTITGVKNFNVLPTASVAPNSQIQLVNKEYVDSKILSTIDNRFYRGTVQANINRTTFIALPIRPQSFMLYSIEVTGGFEDYINLEKLSIYTKRVGDTGFNITTKSEYTVELPSYVLDTVYINYVIVW
jgi:hypothetical protein